MQPGRSGPAGKLGNSVPAILCHKSRLLFTNHRVLEKASRASAIWIAFNNQHPLRLPYSPNSFGHLPQRWVRVGRKRAPNIRVVHCRRAAHSQPVSNRRDHITASVHRIEPAAAVSERALPGAQLHDRVFDQIVSANPRDCAGDLLPISADVLNGSCPHRPRNPGKALQTGAVLLHRALNKSIPILPGRDFIIPLSGIRRPPPLCLSGQCAAPARRIRHRQPADCCHPRE